MMRIVRIIAGENHRNEFAATYEYFVRMQLVHQTIIATKQADHPLDIQRLVVYIVMLP